MPEHSRHLLLNGDIVEVTTARFIRCNKRWSNATVRNAIFARPASR